MSAVDQAALTAGHRGTKFGWYLRRLQKMSAAEVARRLREHTRKAAWARYQVRPGPAGAPSNETARDEVSKLWRQAASHARPQRAFTATLPAGALGRVPPGARSATLAAAREVLAGRWEVLGALRTDMERPDWFLDPLTGRRAPQSEYCFRVDHREEAVTGNIKQVWELSRMHHVTVLAAAFALSRDERYAGRAASHLRSWWRENPFLSGVHWASGIEAGVRLVSWTWARRLLDGWEGAPGLFERNDEALAQIWWHQKYLASFRSHGSSANNHVIAEAAGQLVASLSFNWFDESDAWASSAARLLETQLASNTFPSGANREMAFDYHGFVAELGLVAAAEADLAGRPVGDGTWALLGRMLDVVAATADSRLRAPRYGDGDDGRALVLDPSANRWEDLLALGGTVFGAPAWWPVTTPGTLSTCLAAISSEHPLADRPERRPCHFADAGITIMRSAPSDGPELWCRCDSGPHGFLSIAAHAHADALALEVRHDGVDVLADPGTYCYHGEARWRSYFRSTLAHNTLELGGRDQCCAGGPFLWRRHAHARLLELRMSDDGEAELWSGEHDGYTDLGPPAVHRRTVHFSRRQRRIEITDDVVTSGQHAFRMAFHLGPCVQATLRDRSVELEWASATAALQLPEVGAWRLARGEEHPVLGWWSQRFGEKQPSTTVLGHGSCGGGTALRTVLQFHA
jgi:hypothetical protein